jgi:glycosyltransferase involved in cell wall biosynthesis
MKIVHIVESLDDGYGGPAKSVTNLAKCQRENGAEVLLMSLGEPSVDHNSVISEHKLNWVICKQKGPRKVRFSTSFFLKLIKLTGRDGYFFHIHNLWNFVTLATFMVARFKKVPYAISVRGALYPWSLSQGRMRKKIMWVLFQKKMFKMARWIHVTSKEEAECVKKLGINTQMVILPNGVDFSEDRAIRSSERDGQNILFLSRIHPKKGLDYLVKSFLSLRGSFPKWSLDIVGPIEEKTYYQSLIEDIEQHGASDQVRFLGESRGDERWKYFSEASFFCLPSQTENFGIVIAEALQASCPVLTTTNTPWQALEEFNCGWWVPLDEQVLTSTLERAMLNSPEELVAMGNRGREHIQSFKWPDIAKRFSPYYQLAMVKGEKV